MENLGEMNVIEFEIIGERAERIRCFEHEMLKKYQEVAKQYLPLIREYGCELHLELGWSNTLRKEWSPDGLPMKNDYRCYAYCGIERNGEVVRIESNDGEADYYPLDCAWTISEIHRHFCKLRVLLFADIDDDMDTDIKEMLLALQNMTF